MHFEKAFTFLFCLLFVAVSVQAQVTKPIAGEESRQVLAEWLSIDQRFPAGVTRVAVEPDAIGPRFRIEFTADDGQRVNGTLAMPATNAGVAALALALHPMGANQKIWWRENTPLFGNEITAHLRGHGFAVLALDARWHGERKEQDIGPRQIIELARSENPRPYHQMIANSVRDYRLALKWAQSQYDLDTRNVFAIGYSMGAQMTLLLASQERRVNTVLAMVPPYVDRDLSPVAPRNHVAGIEHASVKLLAARNDPYSSIDQTRQMFDAIGSSRKVLRFFDSEHLLPPSFLPEAIAFIDAAIGTRSGVNQP